MKITPRPRNSGHIFLVFVLLIAIVIIGWVGYKIIDKLEKNPIDPFHGYTNELDITFSPQLDQLRRLLPTNAMVSVTLTQFDSASITVPLEALAHKWHWRVDRSSNMVTWEPTSLGWDEALAINRTNHPGQQGYFRRVLLY